MYIFKSLILFSPASKTRATMGTLNILGLIVWTVFKHSFSNYLKISVIWDINFKGHYAESNFSFHHKNRR